MGLIKSLIKAPFKVAGFAIKTPFKIASGVKKGMDKSFFAVDNTLENINHAMSKPTKVVKIIAAATLLGLMWPNKKSKK